MLAGVGVLVLLVRIPLVICPAFCLRSAAVPCGQSSEGDVMASLLARTKRNREGSGHLMHNQENRVMSAKIELALRVRRALAQGESVPWQDALQLRNWSVATEDAMLPLEEIARRILRRAVNGSREENA
jgi:hypothetical protein